MFSFIVQIAVLSKFKKEFKAACIENGIYVNHVTEFLGRTIYSFRKKDQFKVVSILLNIYSEKLK